MGQKLAMYQTPASGLHWLDDLVPSGEVIAYPGNGYPSRYTARAAAVLPKLLSGPPEAREVWAREEGDILLPGYLGKTWMDRAAIAGCSDDEWLLIEVWDES